MTRSREAWILFLATRVVGLAVDAAVIGFAYLCAFALRFDFQEPTSLGGWGTVARLYHFGHPRWDDTRRRYAYA